MPALTPAVGGAWLTLDQENANAGQAVTEAYPGAISTDHAGGPELVPGRDPSGGQTSSDIPPDTSGIDDVSDGGGSFVDGSSSYGYSAPVACFDSNAVQFAGSGAIADTHSEDDGAVERHSQVLMPKMFGWARRVLSSAKYEDNAYRYTAEGFKVNTANGQTALDQYQSQDANAYDPFPVDYSERALYANLAYEPNPLTGATDAYTPSGNLMDMTPTGGQGNNLYNEPNDPAVNTSGMASAPAPNDFEGGDF